MKPENGYVINNACAFEFKLRTSQIQDVSKNERMKFVVDSKKCCGRALNAKFHITVDNPRESYGICSPKFMMEDTPWRILFWKEEGLQIYILKDSKVSSDYYRSAKIYYNLKSNRGANKAVIKTAK